MRIDTLSTGAVLDVDGTLARFGGDRKLFQDILGFFVEDAPPLMDDLQSAVASEDCPAIRSKAHALKGLAAGCGGVRAAQAAQRVENAGTEHDLDDIEPLMESLQGEFDQLRRAIALHSP